MVLALTSIVIEDFALQVGVEEGLEPNDRSAVAWASGESLVSSPIPLSTNSSSH